MYIHLHKVFSFFFFNFPPILIKVHVTQILQAGVGHPPHLLPPTDGCTTHIQTYTHIHTHTHTLTHTYTHTFTYTHIHTCTRTHTHTHTHTQHTDLHLTVEDSPNKILTFAQIGLHCIMVIVIVFGSVRRTETRS